jgi:TolB-like protein
MRTLMVRWTVALALTEAGPLSVVSATAQTTPTVIAILPFEDRGSYGQDKEVFRALTLGIPAVLANELRGHANLRLADRNKVAQALRGQGLGANAQVDAATAARVANQVGARYAITGSFADFYGTFRLDGRIVDAETGQILRVVTNNDPKLQDRADLYRIIQMVAHKTLAEVSPAALRSGSPQAEMRSIPTPALTQYSLGMLYEHQGDRKKASEHYDQALTVLPDYPEAKEGLRRMGGP